MTLNFLINLLMLKSSSARRRCASCFKLDVREEMKDKENNRNILQLDGRRLLELNELIFTDWIIDVRF